MRQIAFAEHRMPADWERPAAEIEALVGEKLSPLSASCRLLLGQGRHRQPVKVYDPAGELLLVYLPGWLRPDIGRAAYEVLSQGKMIHQGRNNRGTGSGKIDGTATPKYVLRSGEMSKQSFNPALTRSGVMGYFDRYPRFPYHRATSFLDNYPNQWATLQPFVRAADRAFAAGYPEHYQVQRAFADATAQDFVIKGTAFTSVTVNHDWATACHRDAGDLKEGFGVIACLRAGAYSGGYLCMPRYQVAVDMQSCDVLLFNVHEVHGNLPLRGIAGRFKRITCVFYYREKMICGGTLAYELDRAKRCRELGCLYDAEEIAKGEALKREILERFGLGKANGVAALAPD